MCRLHRDLILNTSSPTQSTVMERANSIQDCDINNPNFYDTSTIIDSWEKLYPRNP